MTAYVVGDSNITNPEGMQEYAERVAPILAKHGGKVLIAGSDLDVIEGDWNPKRIVVIEFPSMDALKTWYNSPEYQEILPIRKHNADTNVIFVEGI